MGEGGTDKKSKPLTKAQRAIVNAGTEIRLDRATAADAAYLARQFVQATLPHSDPKADTWSRQNGNFTLGIQAGFNVKTGKSYGLPYGIIPRLLLFWITTEALKTKSPRLELGASMAGFMREVGLDPGHGGKRSDGQRLQVQMTRLFQARISFMQDVQDGAKEGSAWLNMQVSRKGVLWWNPRSPAQGSLWNSWIETGARFLRCHYRRAHSYRRSRAACAQAKSSCPRSLCAALLRGISRGAHRPSTVYSVAGSGKATRRGLRGRQCGQRTCTKGARCAS